MESFLNELIVANVVTFMMIFARLGVALLIMPGIGDSFVSPQIRIHFALAVSFVLTPFLSPSIPDISIGSGHFVLLIVSESFIGMFIGIVMRIAISALDTAGMIVATQAGFANAQLFNPVTATQGSLTGALYSVLGITILLLTNMHHYMLTALVNSYQAFPVNGSFIDLNSVTEVITRTVASAFKVGVEIAIPFLIVGTLLQIGFGLLGRLMPQVQIFFLALPVQILLSLIMLAMVLSAGMLFWLNNFESTVAQSILPPK